MCNGPGTVETMRILVVLAAVVAAGAIGTTRASATTTADRQAQLSQLRGDTVAAQARYECEGPHWQERKAGFERSASVDRSWAQGVASVQVLARRR
jgi:hypothetical protein